MINVYDSHDIHIRIKRFDMIFSNLLILIYFWGYFSLLLLGCRVSLFLSLCFFFFLCFFFHHPCLFHSHYLSFAHSRACCTLATMLQRNQTGGILKRFPTVMRRQTPQVICTSCGVMVTGEHMIYRSVFLFF